MTNQGPSSEPSSATVATPEPADAAPPRRHWVRGILIGAPLGAALGVVQAMIVGPPIGAFLFVVSILVGIGTMSEPDAAPAPTAAPASSDDRRIPAEAPASAPGAATQPPPENQAQPRRRGLWGKIAVYGSLLLIGAALVTAPRESTAPKPTAPTTATAATETTKVSTPATAPKPVKKQTLEELFGGAVPDAYRNVDADDFRATAEKTGGLAALTYWAGRHCGPGQRSPALDKAITASEALFAKEFKAGYDVTLQELEGLADAQGSTAACSATMSMVGPAGTHMPGGWVTGPALRSQVEGLNAANFDQRFMFGDALARIGASFTGLRCSAAPAGEVKRSCGGTITAKGYDIRLLAFAGVTSSEIPSAMLMMIAEGELTARETTARMQVFRVAAMRLAAAFSPVETERRRAETVDKLLRNVDVQPNEVEVGPLTYSAGRSKTPLTVTFRIGP